MAMTNDKILAAALAAGFTLKTQPDGSQALNPYVFKFGHMMFAAGQQEAQEEIAKLHQEQEQASESFQLALLSSSQWQQRAELAERQRDEWRALAEELQARLADACKDATMTKEL